MDDPFRGNSSQSNLKRVPSSGVGINLLKFPPGFFGDDPFKMLDGRMSRKRSNEKKKHDMNNDMNTL